MSNSLSVAGDGAAALAFLHRDCEYADAPRPDLIMLDLDRFIEAVESIEQFWLTIVALPLEQLE